MLKQVSATYLFTKMTDVHQSCESLSGKVGVQIDSAAANDKHKYKLFLYRGINAGASRN